VLVEFFTAQGCDPCRPTSHSLAQLASARDILLLTFSVDHWDYLGWRDTHVAAAGLCGRHGHPRPHHPASGRERGAR
jgi:hypothetical protein